MEGELRVEDVLALVHEKAKEVDDVRVYYALRKMKLRYLTPATVKVVKYAVALTELGLPITASLMTSLLKKVLESVMSQLHGLGDKHVLLFKRRGSGRYEWTLSPAFMKCYYGSAGEDSGEVEACLRRRGVEAAPPPENVPLQVLLGLQARPCEVHVRRVEGMVETQLLF